MTHNVVLAEWQKKAFEMLQREEKPLHSERMCDLLGLEYGDGARSSVRWALRRLMLRGLAEKPDGKHWRLTELGRSMEPAFDAGQPEPIRRQINIQRFENRMSEMRSDIRRIEGKLDRLLAQAN